VALDSALILTNHNAKTFLPLENYLSKQRAEEYQPKIVFKREGYPCPWEVAQGDPGCW
jgi:hypothetical protein